MFCDIKSRNHQTRKGNKIKLIFTRLSTRKNKQPHILDTTDVKKHRALNNLVKYLKNIETDKTLMESAHNRNYLSQDKIHIGELQEKLKEVNKSLTNANKKVLNIGEIVNDNMKNIANTQNEIRLSIDQKI